MSSIVLEGALLVVHCLKIVVELGKKRALSSILATAALRASAARSGSEGTLEILCIDHEVEKTKNLDFRKTGFRGPDPDY